MGGNTIYRAWKQEIRREHNSISCTFFARCINDIGPVNLTVGKLYLIGCVSPPSSRHGSECDDDPVCTGAEFEGGYPTATGAARL